MRIQHVFYAILLFTFASCASLEEPIEMISYDGSQVQQFSGQLIQFKAGFHVQNKLPLALKMKPSSFEIFIDQQKVGNLYVDEPIKLKALKENNLTVPMHIVPEPGFMTLLYKSAKQNEVNVKISGYPKVGVLFLYKTQPVSKDTKLQPAQFLPNLPIF
ncbi:MAG: hypothetical protein RLZZ65_1900 [Bacteroidota bacterium]|jgi:YbbR domain-containing protein